MYAAIGQRQSALATLSEVGKLKRENSPGYERVAWEKIYYETGNLQFWFDDLDQAMENLRRATASAEQMKELDLNTGALAFHAPEVRSMTSRSVTTSPSRSTGKRYNSPPAGECHRESQHYIEFRPTAVPAGGSDLSRVDETAPYRDPRGMQSSDLARSPR